MPCAHSHAGLSSISLVEEHLVVLVHNFNLLLANVGQVELRGPWGPEHAEGEGLAVLGLRQQGRKQGGSGGERDAVRSEGVNSEVRGPCALATTLHS